MQRLEERLVYSASDLNHYLECKRLTDLDALVVRGKLVRPDADDPQAALLQRKGDEHERAYLEQMRLRYPDEVVEFGRAETGIEAYRRAEARTLDAMRDGKRIIYQATFFDGEFIGHADFLRRVDAPSNLGTYGYEVIDTKLGLSPRPYYLIQLCNYSEHLERLQGVAPTFGHVVFGDQREEAFRLHDYMAYYRRLKRRFLEFAGDAAQRHADQPREYPFKCKHCAVCPWNSACERQRRDDDHLSFVAGMRRDHIAKLEAANIRRLAELAAATDDARPLGMSHEMFAKLRRQASLQVRGAERGAPIYELLRHAPPLGFTLLPHPATGDVFFDMEGDPLYEPGRRLEYLFGCWMPDEEPEYRAFWALDRKAEKRAFEEFVDFIIARRRSYPALHVYHYANYEKEALRRLAQEHCTRENEVDDLLRGQVMIDLFAVVRQALMISEERYGLKNLERFYDLVRETEVKKGDASIVMFESWMLDRKQAILDDIEFYNRDDCRSTWLLRDWLLERRAEAIAEFGTDFPLRDAKLPEAPCHPDFTDGCKTCEKERREEREEARRSNLERKLLAAPDGSVARLLGHLMGYHRREAKPAWWAYFDRCENVDNLLEFDRDAIGGLALREEVAPFTSGRSMVYTFAFPEQQHKLGPGQTAVDPRTQKSLAIHNLDPDARRIEIKTTAPLEIVRAITELIPGRPFSNDVQRAAVERIADSFARAKLAEDFPATHDVLTARAPRLRTPRTTLQPQPVTAAAIAEIARALDSSYLFIQGPPGSGKSTIGSELICALLADGKRVAVTSTSHKAIHNLLHMVEARSAERGLAFRGLYKSGGDGSAYVSDLPQPFITSVETNEEMLGDEHQLAGGTGWLFAREELAQTFDYLFIDEAGQVSLADALASSLCARNIVVLGDPSQLPQVNLGTQPEGAGDSVLAHLLGEARTVSPERGIFLDRSYRMQPEICAFVSDAMYDDRLHAAEQTATHRIVMPGHELAGLYFAGIDHAGNSSSSPDEADEVVRIVAQLLADGMVVDSRPKELDGIPRRIAARDIVVVTPYNAQLRLILARLARASIDVEPQTGVRVGTVDKFQGQEAPVVLYSMATSSGEDVPRNVEFLFDRNRFNVAISRARAVSILLCSPRLLDIRCRTPKQMALANLLCAFEQRAKPIPRLQAAVV